MSTATDPPLTTGAASEEAPSAQVPLPAIDRLLDEALENTFPASDPIAIGQIRSLR